MTVIGVVSDTHFPRFGRALPRALERGLRDARVERILHLGDMTDLLAVPLFEAIAPFDAVAGNNDGEAIRARFGRRKIVQRRGRAHRHGPRRRQARHDDGRARWRRSRTSRSTWSCSATATARWSSAKTDGSSPIPARRPTSA